MRVRLWMFWFQRDSTQTTEWLPAAWGRLFFVGIPNKRKKSLARGAKCCAPKKRELLRSNDQCCLKKITSGNLTGELWKVMFFFLVEIATDCHLESRQGDVISLLQTLRQCPSWLIWSAGAVIMVVVAGSTPHHTFHGKNSCIYPGIYKIL